MTGRADGELLPGREYSKIVAEFFSASPTIAGGLPFITRVVYARPHSTACRPMDSSSFHKLALNEVESVHRLAYHLCRDQHEAEDLVQETYLRALKSADTYQPGAHGVRPWLYKILHNVLHRRRSRDRGLREILKRRMEQNSGEGSAAAVSYPSNEDRATVSDLNWDGLDQRLCQAIRLLPVAHRTVFLLSALEDLKYREIADVVGAPVGTVMSRLSRARTALAAQLGDLAAEQNLARPRRRIDRQAPSAPSSD